MNLFTKALNIVFKDFVKPQEKSIEIFQTSLKHFFKSVLDSFGLPQGWSVFLLQGQKMGVC